MKKKSLITIIKYNVHVHVHCAYVQYTVHTYMYNTACTQSQQHSRCGSFNFGVGLLYFAVGPEHTLNNRFTKSYCT